MLTTRTVEDYTVEVPEAWAPDVLETHTHPRREQSYAVTTDHERRL